MQVTVRGTDQLAAPLLVTDKASAIEFRDSAGELCAIFANNALTLGYWNFVTKADDDWIPTLRRLGYLQELSCPPPSPQSDKS